MTIENIWMQLLDNPTLSVLPHDYLRPQQEPFIKQEELIVQLPQLDLPFEGFEDKYTVFLALWSTLIFRLSGDADIVLYITGNKVLRFQIQAECTFQHLIEIIRSKLDELSNIVDEINFDCFAEKIQQEQDLEKTPQLFRLAGLLDASSDFKLNAFKYHPLDLAINLRSINNTHTLELIFNAYIYSTERIQTLSDQFIQFISVVQQNPQCVITQASLVTPESLNRLPNPTRDLDWCGFVGCIQDIFQDNAESFPDRTCVVETGSSKMPRRTFTYQDINRASNIVAHYLIDTGIKVGDVVMIYSSRGVDLMICVLGVLKAGATFSVIDPAYPPARQTVYLDVARPKGLIVIRSAGVLDSLVENFIKDELEVITRIPSVAIQADGTLQGSLDQTNDILSKYETMKDQRTGVIVGPDSNPTLSFTSGSEGKPKGVLGRHYSLAYYFSWMASQFNLSSKDRFTMLSGIAHDPIQRDMFTPLFLGAQLYVPTEEDICTPGQLAKWMSDNNCTITHLTPAMGQLLTAQAVTPFPKLHHAFFVGDVLTKRDCLRLQTLAENCCIVNMYGTTETQRAVSYFEVHSRTQDPDFLKNLKNVMPAGRGMKNVQLLVINRNDRSQICGVGEVGEIYVRAAGLAEGYRGLPDLNKEKFVKNWFVDDGHWNHLDKDRGEPWRKFWLGPRDRLYRTGDLGRYLPNGDCECCGRADDQIKIRGFRIELGEIDTHISQHSLVRENITLVRKNANNEPTLITFIVPRFDMPNELAEFQTPVPESVKDQTVRGLIAFDLLGKDIKLFLRKRLPSYAIPSLILAWDKLPLNPNGKVDKPKLQFPTEKQLKTVVEYSPSTSDDGELSPIERKIRDIWSDILPITASSMSINDSFFDLGGHSILATKMFFTLKTTFNIDLPLNSVFKFPTIKTLAAEIVRLGKSSVQNNPQASTGSTKTAEYESDARQLVNTLPESYASRSTLKNDGTINVFVTGATGFLGSYIISNILNRSSDHQTFKVFAHVRADTKEKGLKRLEKAGVTYGTWSAAFSENIEVILGDLSKRQFGLPNEMWTKLGNEIDVIIHNGALVHWVYPYSKLRDANVVSTVNVMNLASFGKPKFFDFVSSTSTLDSKYYFKLSDQLVSEGKSGITEADDLMGSAHTLSGGYGQSKWAAEYIIRKAGERGLRGCIVRPGYITGCSTNGSSNTDDFLLRCLKSAVQLGKIPDIRNTVNMVPVDHVAEIVVATAFHPPSNDELAVAHVTGHPRILFKDYLYSLHSYGYNVEVVDYEIWKASLEHAIVQNNEDNALYPLLHMVLDDLPNSTRAPELDDTNTVKSLKMDAPWIGQDVSAGKGATEEQVGIYISFLNKVNFLPSSTGKGRLPLPEVELTDAQIRSVSSGASARTSSASTQN
ncbi:hypothetical protein KAFR_0D02630 [Kazachstania africana CBS 2517]|uniref:Alpha-aminoadipate reductase n=1 Tax=Kazachstania africana (strain ATCC 22294 / BCRC 22015 / CBS 2517 / CECT 1963 / NBRC 1671 / NRRL Y-8276) TaxID=1071382 RepID=H2AU61_KAZAF|nr:hypothetical protein KAFR_0D02630 [Kazachstania africana CBS 2517]CCF57911.1 hypothetical protein KAFR_0D02630 [Kazachstania africana CBS 2517]